MSGSALLTADRQRQLAVICARWRVRNLSLFGSVAEGTAVPGQSDLDFLVEFEPMPPGEHADSYFGLIEDLESLFASPVDLVERKAIRNPYFRAAVERTRRLIFEANA